MLKVTYVISNSRLEKELKDIFEKEIKGYRGNDAASRAGGYRFTELKLAEYETDKDDYSLYAWTEHENTDNTPVIRFSVENSTRFQIWKSAEAVDELSVRGLYDTCQQVMQVVSDYLARTYG